MNRTLLSALFLSLSQVLLVPGSQALTPSCNYNTPGYIVNRFADNNDGSVYDNYTGLIWQKCNLGQIWNTEYGICARDTDPVKYDWKNALSTIQDFNNTEFSNERPYNWRLPNIKELSSIINLSCVYPSIDTSIFDTEETQFWSSTPSATLVPNIQNDSGPAYVYENYIWGVNFMSGQEFREPWSSQNSVLLVRDDVKN